MGVLIIGVLVVGLIPAFIARSKGRSFVGFWIYGTLLFVVALPHALLAGPKRIRGTVILISVGAAIIAFIAVTAIGIYLVISWNNWKYISFSMSALIGLLVYWRVGRLMSDNAGPGSA